MFDAFRTRPLRSFLVRLVVPVFFVVLFASNAFSATPVSIDGVEENGYGRLVFGWPNTGLSVDPSIPDTRLPTYEAIVSAGVLVVTFEREFDVETDELLRRMPRYLALIRRDPDGKTLRLAMKSDFKLYARPAGYELYLDLLAPGWTGAPPPLPASVAARVAEEEAERQRLAAAFEENGPQPLEIDENPPEVELYIGQRPGSTRLAFTWDRPVLYSTAFRDNRITVTFDQIADIALASVRVDPPAFIVSARSVKSGGRLTVFLETEPGMKVRDFREDLSVVLDVSPIRATRTQPIAAAPPTPLLPSPRTPSGPALEDPEEVRAMAAQLAAADEAAGGEEPVHANQGMPTPDVNVPALVDTQARDEAAQTEEAAEAPLEPTDQNDAADAVAIAGSSYTDDGENVNEEALPVYAELLGDSVRLSFPWKSEVNAAIFQREGRVWMLFDRTTEFDLSSLSLIVRERLGEPTVLQLDRATVLQFLPAQRVLLTAAEKDNEWVVTLGGVIVEPTRPVNVSRTWTDVGEPRVVFDLESAARVHWVLDPVVQDSIAIVTAAGPPQGLLAPRNFVEFHALATAQGVAFVSRADDLYVRTADEGILVSRGSGLPLSLSDGPRYSGAGDSSLSDPTAPGRMDFKRWRYSPGDTFTERKQFHQNAVANATGVDAASARVRFAKFLLSYRLGAEAYTLLRAALVDMEELEVDPGFLALRGVAQVMMGRYEAAIIDLSAPSLSEDPHSALWLGVAYAEQGEWADSWRSFERAEQAFSFEQAEQAFAFYGPDLQALFRVKAAEAALASGDVGRAEFNLDRVPEDTAEPRWPEQAKLTRARLLEASGRIDEALEIFDALSTSSYRAIAARARFSHAMLRHQLGALDDPALINELEALRFMWRGDDLELAVLEQLGELRVGAGEIAQGLETWRSAVGLFAQTARGRRIASRMTEVFADLYLAGGADEMDPLDALTVYYNFRELTPIGRRGDALIRNLADRLADIDLLDKASDLLRHQVENRLRGTARAQVAAKLALFELMNHQPERALQAIRSTKQVRLPAELAHKRRLLEARALTDLGLFDHALDLLSETEGEGVDDLVADIYWESQEWDTAAGHFEEALGERWRDPLELTSGERFQVMRAAISYSLSDDVAGLDRIRSKFGDLMRAGPDAAGFAVVTDPIETHGVAFRDLARSVASADTLDSFVESMRESFAEIPEASETAIN